MVRVPNIAGVIDRRFLINYRVAPEVLIRQIPAPFRPHLVRGYGIAGICVLRLSQLRPEGLPRAFGISTDNAAHRVAVEWDGPDGPCRGVYIARRDTSSKTTVYLGGRLFPGVHHRADFEFREQTNRYEVAFKSRRDGAMVSLSAVVADNPMLDSVFSSLDDASLFFQQSPLGFSPGHQAQYLEGLELRCERWSVEALDVTRVVSSYFDDASKFPPDSVSFDSAFLMRNIESTWLTRTPEDPSSVALKAPVVMKRDVLHPVA
jgi:uncharacterized protein DUF2071